MGTECRAADLQVAKGHNKPYNKKVWGLWTDESLLC